MNTHQINLILSLLCLAWVIAYSVNCIKYFDVLFAALANDFEIFKYLGYGFAGFGFIALFALMTVPQYIIGKRIKKQAVENE